ncbi:MAG: transporter [Gemmatimonadota bacterium]|nr:transporter [Gemmatimonadota bacterium]
MFLNTALILAVAALTHPARAQGDDSPFQRLPSASSVGAAQDSARRDPHAVQPERPTVATHAGTVARGWIELEQGGEWDKLDDGTKLFLAPSNLKIGLTSRAQLNLLINVFKFRDRSASLGDLTIGVKYRIVDDDPWLGDFAILPAVKLPTAASANGPGTGTTDFTLLLVSSRELGPVAVDLNAGLTRRSGDGSRAPTTAQIWAASFGFPLTGPLGAVAELFAFPRTSGPAGSDAIVAFLVGPTFLVREWLALDAGIITPLTGPQPRAVYAGFVWNFGCLDLGNTCK